MRHLLAKITAVAAIAGALGFGIAMLVMWIWPPMTTAQAYKDGYADGFSTEGYQNFPFGKWTCVNDWNAVVTGFDHNQSNQFEVTGGIAGLGFVQGGPPATKLITMSNQDTGTVLGNAWMAGCRAGLAALGSGY